MPISAKAKRILTPLNAIILAAIVLVLVLIGALAKRGAFVGITHSFWLPWVVLAIAIVLTLLIIFVGLPWYRERQFVRQLGSGYRIAGQQSPQELQAKFSSGFRAYCTLPQHAGKGEPSYALPWFLLIGAGQSGKTEAVKTAGTFSSLTTARDGATQNFDFWVSNSVLLLDTAGRYAIASDIERDRAEWYRLLRLIKHYHGREPINGIVIAVGADHLVAQSDETLRADAAQQRERIEDAIKVLALSVPVYVLVTKCDVLDGFDEFTAALPARVLNEAVGFIDEPITARGPSRGHEQFMRLQSGLESMYEQLRNRGIAVLNGKAAESLRRPLFCFPEEFRLLAARLGTFLEVLSGEDVRYHTPLLRGVFLSAARQQELRLSLLRTQLGITSSPPSATSKPTTHCFLRDVFDVILPRDRGLASGSKVA
ncbi:MAG TPA: type VI secretion protein IcmF/TssM N-terminal domain-containing protein [Candidatus Binataceae bacterium]|nr:type VI secretion protein IcmF/TssM N-terminal domain-containing protein [Candidatus Binataceae bacterium]